MAAAMLASAAFAEIQYTTQVVDGCIRFVNGAGHYADNCYISGLQNMAPNTCYKVRQSRINDGSVPQTGHMNNNAADTWWWKTTECTKVTILVPVPGTYDLVPNCVEFQNGFGNFANKCYSSGLHNMSANTCYTVNPDRIADGSLPQTGYMNNNAADAWWWVETNCNTIVPLDPPDICNTNPSDGACLSFCTTNPNNSFCVSNLCAMFPADPSCAVPSVCSNPNDPACLAACLADPLSDPACEAVICADDPSKPMCSDACQRDFYSAGCQAYCMDPVHASTATCGQSACAANPTDPVCVSYCAANSTDPVCLVPPTPTATQEDCLIDPDGTDCQAFCAANPNDGACKADYCVDNPNDPNCFDKCINFVQGKGGYGDHCYKSGLLNMNGKCYTMNPARAPAPQDINNNAADGWWWVETACEKEYIIPRVNWTLQPKGCVPFVNGFGNFANKCFSSGLQNMAANNVAENKCYEVNPDRIADGSLPQFGYMNDNAADAWWWVETLCADTIPPRPFEGRVAPKTAPKAAPVLGESQISVDNTTLSVTSTVADTKMLRVFDMNGKLLHSESFSGMAKDVDFAKFAGKGVLLVRITSGNKLVGMKKVSIR